MAVILDEPAGCLTTKWWVPEIHEPGPHFHFANTRLDIHPIVHIPASSTCSDIIYTRLEFEMELKISRCTTAHKSQMHIKYTQEKMFDNHCFEQSRDWPMTGLKIDRTYYNL